MPVTERRTRRRRALRDAILDAARSIVRERGSAELTIRGIAEAIDYAPATLYTHFASREALLAELCREGMAGLLAALEAAVAGVREPRARLAALGAAYVRYALQNPQAYRLIFMEDAARTSGVFASPDGDEGARALGLIATELGALRAAGRLRRGANLTALTDLYWTIVHGLASLRLACGAMPSTDDATLLAAAVATLVEGSRPRVPSRLRVPPSGERDR